MSVLATCTVLRVGGPIYAEEDSQRLGLDLNKSNNYSGSFEGQILSFTGQIHAYVINTTNKTLHLVKLGEITNVVGVEP